MKPTVVSSRKIEYLSTSGKSLRLFLSGNITLNDFYTVFAQVIEIAKAVCKNSLNLTNLLLDLNYSFINMHTKEVHFVYQPLQTDQFVSQMPSFLCEMIQCTRLENPQEYAALNHLNGFIQSTQFFSLELMEEYILKNYPQIYKQIPRYKPGQSQMLKGDDLYYRQDKIKKPELSYQGASAVSDSAWGNDSDTALLLEEEDEATSLLMEEEEEATSLLVEETEEATSLLVEEEDEATSLLMEDDGTALLTQQQINYPFLIRKSNFDRVDVNKPVFRVGKERSYVDYFVQNNSAVSRLHADILNKNGHYFIKDNNSTNGTIINGQEIPPEREVEIFDGDEIILANEEFEFHFS